MRGGKRDGAGRKPGSKNVNRRTDCHTVVKQVRWTEEGWKLVAQAARKIGETPSEFVRIASFERAGRESTKKD